MVESIGCRLKVVKGSKLPLQPSTFNLQPANLQLSRLVLLLILGVLATLLVPGLSAQSSSKRDLERIRSEIRRLRGNLTSLKAKTESTEKELEVLDLQLEIHSRELEAAQTVERELAAKEADLQREVEMLRIRIEEQRRALSQRLAALYRLGRLSYVRILLALDQKQNPFEAAAMLSYMVQRDARSIESYQRSRAEWERQGRLLAEEQERLRDARVAVEQRSNEVRRARAQKQALLSRLEAEGSRSLEKIAGLEEKARRLEALFALLYERSSGSGPELRGIEDFRGALEWPVSGKVIENFGRHRSERFATFTVSNGLKIEVASGTEVRAVFEGTVLFSQWFKGYGNLIIIDHGHRIFSLYGNTRGITVNVGDRIATGQRIALVEQDESGSSGYLYFEVREDNKPADPRTWLR